MAKLTLQQLGDRLRRERGQRGMREVAGEIGVSSATLSRVERGNLPDLDTFRKICRWLDLDPAAILGLQKIRAGEEEDTAVTAHFRADQTVSTELAQALAQMILAAQKKLKQENR